MRLDIRVQALPGPELVERYLARDPDVLAFFAGNPFSLEDYLSRASELRTAFSLERRSRAAKALQPTSDVGRAKLARFVEDGGVMVTTGQQAGLFSGPLYTIYKALTAIRLAEALESRLGVTVLPVFWTASEDHDWAEVNNTYVVDGNDRLRRIELGSREVRPLPMFERQLDDDTAAAVALMQEVVGMEAHGDAAMDWIRSSYVPGRTVSKAFSELLNRLFHGFDLFLTDASDPVVKQASRAVLRRELAAVDENGTALHDTVAQLGELGLQPQVPILPRAANVFLQTGHGRERLFRSQDGWITRESGRRLRAAELDQIIETEPHRLSPNVLMRPVVENSLFPVLAYVGGPGEIAYYAQLGPLFASHERSMPMVYPRASMLLLERRVQRQLEESGIELSDLLTPRHQLIRKRSLQTLPADVEAGLADLSAALVRGFDHLGERAARLDPTLRSAIGVRRNRALLEVREAEQKVLRAVGRREENWIARVDRLRNHLAPLGSEQDRVLNLIPFAARHGLELLDEIASGITFPWMESASAVSAAAAGILLRPKGEVEPE